MKLTLLEFCAQTFLCRWDKSLLNIVLLFLTSLLAVKVGKHYGILLGEQATILDMSTALFVTVMVLLAGYIEKRRNYGARSRDEKDNSAG